MTYSVLLVLALAVAGLGVGLRRRAEGWGQVLMIAGVIGCGVCVAWQVRQTVFTPSPKGPDRGQAVVAYFLAQHVLAEAGNRQGQLWLLFPPESVFDEEAVGTYAGTFSRVLRGFSGINLRVVRLVVGDKAAKDGSIPAAAFQQALSNASPAVAYVSFAGVPVDFEKLLPVASAQVPSCFVFDPWRTTNWLAGLKQGRIRAVVVPRPGVDSKEGAQIAGEPNEVFKRLYLMATPANAEQVAAQLGVK